MEPDLRLKHSAECSQTFRLLKELLKKRKQREALFACGKFRIVMNPKDKPRLCRGVGNRAIRDFLTVLII